MTRQDLTESDTSQLYRLNPRHEKAIDLVLQGLTDAEVAAAVGVTRPTVNLWRNRHPAFVAELNQRKRAIVQKRQAQLDALNDELLKALTELLKSGDQTVVLGLAKILLPKFPITSGSQGPTDPQEVIPQTVGNPVSRLLADLDGPDAGELAREERSLVQAIRAAEEGAEGA